MDAPLSPHPADETLRIFGLGKLDGEPADAVQKHLEECPECRGHVAQATSDSFLDRIRGSRSPGTTLGRSRTGEQGAVTRPPPAAGSLPTGLADHPDYEVLQELGRGGMGVVYLARNTLLGRTEVLKVIGRKIIERPGVFDRFLREIRAVAKLQHPNIVTAYSAFRLDESIVFAMEYVEGLDLAKMVKAKGRLPVAHACHFAHQAALGLQHAHEEELVHRDIKPANLMLSRKGDKATVKVLDFGLAKAAREEKLDAGLTSAGQALGTPDFIAPEQIMDAHGADIRADIYSLGGTLYYLLTGHPPFKASSLYDIYQAHISRDADPLNLIRPEVPAELAALVAKMMAKDPARRFQTPGEVAKALTPFFKKGNAAFQSPSVAVSAPGLRDESRLATSSAAAPTHPASELGNPRALAEKPMERTIDEGRPIIPIDVEETDPDSGTSPEPAPARRRRWLWPTVAVGVFMIGLPAAWWGGVFKFPTPEGVIVMENVPQDAEIRIDGDTIVFTWPGAGKPLEIRAVPGQHRIEVKKDGFKTFGEVVTVQTIGSQEVTVRLEPLVVEGPGKKGPSDPNSRAGDNQAPPVPHPADCLQPGSVWVSEEPIKTFTILERQGERFKARLEVGRGLREVNGTIKGGRLRWLARDVKAIAGDPGGDNEGEIKGDVISMTWSIPGGPAQKPFELRIKQHGRSSPASGGTDGSSTSAGETEKPSVAKPSPVLIPPAGPARRARTVHGTAWSVWGEQLIKEGLGHGGISFGDPAWTDYDLTFEARKSAGPDGFGAAFRDQVSEGKGYWLILGGLGNKHYLDRWVGFDNKITEIASMPGTLRPLDWYKVKLSLRGPQIRVTLDDHVLFDRPDNFSRKGTISLICWNSAGRFRNIKVTAPDGAVLWEGPPDLLKK